MLKSILRSVTLCVLAATTIMSFVQPAEAAIWSFRIRNGSAAPQTWTVYETQTQQYVWQNQNLAPNRSLTDPAQNYNIGDSFNIGVDDQNYTSLKLTDTGWELFPDQNPFQLEIGVPLPSIVRVSAN